MPPPKLKPGSFSADLARFRMRVGDKMDEISRAVALSVFGSVIIGTPVDTGRAAANWQTAIDRVPSGEVEWEKPSGSGSEGKQNAQGKMESIVLGEGSSKVKIVLVNNLPYIRALEEGHSTQRPNGWVHAIIKDWKRRLKEIMARV